MVFGLLPGLWPSDPGRSLLLPNMPSSGAGWDIGWNVTKIECSVHTLVWDQPGPSSSRDQHPRHPQPLTNPIRLLISNLTLFTKEQHIQFVQRGRPAPGWIARLCILLRPSPRPETAHDYHIISIRTQNSKTCASRARHFTSGWHRGQMHAALILLFDYLHILGIRRHCWKRYTISLSIFDFLFSFIVFWCFSCGSTLSYLVFSHEPIPPQLFIYISWSSEGVESRAKVPHLISYLPDCL